MRIKLKGQEKLRILTTEDAWEVLRQIYSQMEKQDKRKALFWTISLNGMCKVLDIELVAMGQVDRKHITPLEVLSVPLQKRASSIIVAHNSTDRVLIPSKELHEVTDCLIQSARLMKITLFDHLKITEHSFYSFARTGLMEELSKSEKYVLPYELHAKYRKEFRGKLREGRKALKEQKEKLIEKGMAIGEEKGKKAGRKEGRKEGAVERSQEIALQMLSKGYAVSEVQQLTGLTKEALRQLKNNA